MNQNFFLSKDHVLKCLELFLLAANEIHCWVFIRHCVKVDDDDVNSALVVMMVVVMMMIAVVMMVVAVVVGDGGGGGGYGDSGGGDRSAYGGVFDDVGAGVCKSCGLECRALGQLGSWLKPGLIIFPPKLCTQPHQPKILDYFCETQPPASSG